jgi:hypothetical protein
MWVYFNMLLVDVKELGRVGSSQVVSNQ